MTPDVAIVGGGPAGLFAAECLSARGLSVMVFDRMASVGRKFLMAGRGGLNLTHSEPLAAFRARYGEAGDWLSPVLDAFPPDALRAWAEGLGEKTFVGSSGRVFPESFKASPLLRAWLRRLEGQGVVVATRHRLTAIAADPPSLVFDTPTGERRIAPGAAILALGGASWPRLGSDGAWVAMLRAMGVAVAPLTPANVGVEIPWTPTFRERFAGTPTKRMRFSIGEASVLGEAMATAEGLEGGAIYAIGPALRAAIARDAAERLLVDLKPDMGVDRLESRLAGVRPGDSLSQRLRKAAGLSPLAIGLLREGAGGQRPSDPAALAALIKATPLVVMRARPIENAISSAGGVERGGLDDGLMLRALPGIFLAGEMIDWEAPTGGYLLQACFSTAARAANAVAAFLNA